MTASTDESSDESVSQQAGFVASIKMPPLLCFAVLLILLLVYYWPCLSGTGDFYISDLSFYFQPFCQFIGKELRAGIFPLWNPHLYSGMSQLAVPSPALFYPPSFLLFLLPFSVGLSIYMILHQLLGAVGTYMFLRRVGAANESACFGAIAFALCAYNFTLIQNFTLPATVCWLPIALYFCEGLSRIRERGRSARSSEEGILPPAELKGIERAPGRSWIDVVGLVFSTSMIVYCGRPEVGVPALVLLSALAFAHFLFCSPEVQFRAKFFSLAAVGLSILSGILLSAPVLLPGIEWASLSPRAQGLDAKWVLLWSANWFDWLGTILANPLGSLYVLNDTAAQFRHLVLSRGGSIPFVHSSYISSIVFSLAIFGLFCKRKKLVFVLVAIFLVSTLMASGSATPFLPAIIKLSPTLSAFRYPVKLLIVPCMVIMLLAVLGVELVLTRQLALRAAKFLAVFWFVLLLGGMLAYNVPAIAPALAKYLVVGKYPEQTFQMVRVGFSAAVVNSSLLGLITCALCYLSLNSTIAPRFSIALLAALLSGNLLWTSMSIRQIGWAPYFANQPFLVEQLAKAKKEANASPYSRIVNLYFDPLTVPAEYDPNHIGKDQRFFAYARELLLHNIVICGDQESSFGYEAAETKDYKDYFTDALFYSSQHSKAKPETMCDRPLHRFAMITATEFADTQVMKLGKTVPLLDKELFELVKEDRLRNFRIFRVKNPRSRFFLANRIVPVESFADLKKVILERGIVPQTEAFDNNPKIVYVLNRDFFPNKLAFEAINDRFKSGAVQGNSSWEVLNQNSQSISIRCRSQNDGLLYMADHYYPGWIAEIDGNPVSILKANGLNRAVTIPKGEHTLTLSYRPYVLQSGCVIAFIGLLIASMLVLLVSRSEKQAN